MPRASAYVRVSTAGQTTDNQLQEIRAAGFTIEPRRVVTETISGSVATVQRRGFTRPPGPAPRLTEPPRPPRARRRAGGPRARPARPRHHGIGLHGGPTPPR